MIENSLPAFEAAMRGGFAIECDVRPSADSTAMVFHDATLERLTLSFGPISDRSTNDLCQIPLTGSRPTATISTYTDLLAMVHGRCPLLVEVKSDWGPVNPDFIHHIAAPANAYAINVARGRDPDAPDPLMLMSFDPAVVAALAKAAPNIPRGLVSGSYANADASPWWPDVVNDTRRAALRDLAKFEAVGASFVAYEASALPSPRVAELRSRGNPVFAWTVRSTDAWAAIRDHADAPIFEGVP
ncbi:MAG: glycerophosphodiester phosphodiesterase family protein [Hyphomicrobium aestuarii]|nr:glycerophosphodiester phosphodiesterase family protein [Hyphomicrobium aestuarii]